MPDSPLNLEALKVGRNYRIIYRNPAERAARELVASYIGPEDATGVYLSGRPFFGTVGLPIAWITEIWTTDREKSPPVIYRGETRVY